MNDVASLLGGVVLGFALGSIPFGYLLVRARTGADVRASGSGNIGATNVGRALGKSGFLATLLLDAAKGGAAVLVAGWLGLSAPTAALGAVLGHCYTPWLGGKGGKGVATLLGGFALVAPSSTSIAAAALALGAVAFQRVSVGSLLGAAALPIAAWALREPAAIPACAAAAAAVVWWRHLANIRRLLAGAEPKIGGSAG